MTGDCCVSEGELTSFSFCISSNSVTSRDGVLSLKWGQIEVHLVRSIVDLSKLALQRSGHLAIPSDSTT